MKAPEPASGEREVGRRCGGFPRVRRVAGERRESAQDLDRWGRVVGCRVPRPRNGAAFRPRREPVTPMSSFHTGKDAMRRSEGVPGAPFQEYL